MKIILSARDLAWTLGVPLPILCRIADNPGANYHEFSRWKDATRTQARMIRNPRDELKRIQALIKDRVFGQDTFGAEVQGGIKGRSPRTNATAHLGARVLVMVDIRQFYDNVDHKMVFRTLRELGYGTQVARLLTKLTTRKGLLPQGAPTSTVLANLVLARPVDTPTRRQAERTGTKFTRFVDDFALSGDDSPTALIGGIARRLSSCGLSIHRGRKLKICPRSMPQQITGLNINSGRPTVPREYRDGIRAAIHGLAEIADPEARAAAVRRITGRIVYVRQYQPQAAKRLAQQLAPLLTAK